MANGEALNFIEEQYKVFADALSSDLVFSKDDLAPNTERPWNPLRGALVTALVAQGLQGELWTCTAESRSSPVGVPVLAVGMDQGQEYRIGFYKPVKADIALGGKSGSGEVADEIQSRVNAAVAQAQKEYAGQALAKGYQREPNLPVNPADGIVVVHNGQIRRWKESGVFPGVKYDHSSHFTQEDLEYARASNEECMVQYLRAVLDAVVELAEYDLTPEALVTGGPVKRVGRTVVISTKDFVGAGYETLRPRVIDRDDKRCGMPIMNQIKRQDVQFVEDVDIPTCGIDLRGYYPEVGGRIKRVDPNAVVGEVNHIVSQGKGITHAVMMYLEGWLTYEDLLDPEKLLLVMSRANTSALIRERFNSLPESKATWLLELQRVAPLVDLAVNSLPNMLLLDTGCHKGIKHKPGYHPDMNNMALVSLIVGLNAKNGAAIKVPARDSSKLAGWKQDMMDRILRGELVADLRRGKSIQAYMLEVHEMRRLVMMSGRDYVNPDSTMVQSYLARRRTEKSIEAQVNMGKQAALEQIRKLAGDGGVGPEGLATLLDLAGEYSSVEDKVRAMTHMSRSDKLGLKTLERYGLSPEDLDRLGLKGNESGHGVVAG